MKITEVPSEKVVHVSCKDHTVSGETFELLYDTEREMLITSPKPSLNELSKYYQSEDYISHTDSRSSFPDKIYQAVKRYMLQKKLNWINKKFPGKGRLLDIGAGTGDFLLEAKKAGWKVKGIEPEKKARELALKKGIELKKSSRGFPAEKFDVITMWHVFEHVYDLKNQVIELDNLLKKNGLLIIAVPNYKSFDAEYYKEFWAAYDVPRHLWHFSENSFRNIFSGTGIKQKDRKGLIFDSFYVSLLSEKYKSGKTNFFKAFYVGLKSNMKARKTSQYSSSAYFFRKTS